MNDDCDFGRCMTVADRAAELGQWGMAASDCSDDRQRRSGISASPGPRNAVGNCLKIRVIENENKQSWIKSLHISMNDR